MLSVIEKKVLQKIAESQLVSKPELKKFLEANGSKDASSMTDTITKRLIDQKLVNVVSPVGYTCYVITQKGNQALKEMQL